MRNTQSPSPATRAALVAILKADKAISVTHRARILAAFDAPVSERPAGWLPASAVARKVGVSLNAVLQWIDKGNVAARRVGDRLTLVNTEEVAAYAATRPKRGQKPGRDGSAGESGTLAK